MASLAIAGAGAVLGGYLGGALGYAAIGQAVGWAVGAYVGSRLFGEEEKRITGPRLDDLTVQTASYGSGIPKVWGTVRIAGNVIWARDIIERKIEDTEGGKGGGGTTVVTYQYYGTFAVGLCEGEIENIKRIWLDGKLFLDIGSDAETADHEESSDRLNRYCTVYYGDEDQEPDPTIESYEGAGEVPAFRGLAYLVFDELPLKDYGNRVPNVTVEVVDNGNTNNPQTSYECPNTNTFGMCIADGNLVVSSIDSPEKVTVFNGISSTVISEFEVPFNPTDITYMNGNLYIISDEGGGRIYKMQGLSSVILDYVGVQTAYGRGLTHYQGDLIYSLGVFDGYEGVYMMNGDGMDDIGLEIKQFFQTPGSDDLTFGLAVDPNGNLLIGQPVDAPSVPVDTVYIMDGISGTLNDTITPDVPVLRGLAVAPGSGDLLVLSSSDDTVYQFQGISDTPRTTPSVSSTNAQMQTIINDILTEIGITEGNGLQATSIDFSGAYPVIGYVRPKPMTARQVMDPLLVRYNFDPVEYAHKLRFTERGGASLYTIGEEELMAHEYGRDAPNVLETTRDQEFEFPAEVRVHYLAQDRDYQSAVQISRRATANSQAVHKIELPIVMSHAEAKQVAEMQHAIMDIEREKYSFSASTKYLDAAPADVLTVAGYRMRIAAMKILGNLMQISGPKDDDSVYSNDAAAETPPGFTAPTLVFPGPTASYFLDIPLLRDADDDAGFYIAAHGYTSGWKGAALFYSADEGDSFSQVASILTGATAGYIADALGDADPGVYDTENTINVKLNAEGMTLESITEAALLNGGNACAVGRHGAWEILQFQNATLEGDGTYTLDTLIRGRRGTEWMVGEHDDGESFVLLDTSTIRRYSLSSDNIGVERIYRVVSLGNVLQLSSNIVFTNSAVGLEPYSPVDIAGSRDGSNNLTITWKRRTRVGGEWRDYVGPVLGEDTEEYEVDIIDDDSLETVLRTIEDITNETTTYTAAQQTTDGLTPGDPVRVKIYQLSATTGRGYVGDATI